MKRRTVNDCKKNTNTGRCSVVGQPIKRTDAYEKVTGIARYTSDVSTPGMLHVKVLRSPYPNAMITSIDTTLAENYPGVACVLTYMNTTDKKFNWSDATVATDDDSAVVRDMAMFNRHLRYVGDEVAAIAATTEKQASEALKLIKVEYEKLPAVLDVHQALAEGAPILHPDHRPDSNRLALTEKSQGNITNGFAEADVIVEHTFTVPAVKQVQLETQNAMAEFSGDGKLTVWSPTQSPALAQRLLSAIFDIPMHKIRVRNPGYVGGAFGVRIGLSSKAEIYCIEFAKRTGRPVKFVYSRKEDCIASEARHAAEIYVKLGAKKDGTFTALETTGLWNTGAYALSSQGVAACASGHILAPYKYGNFRYSMGPVYTNRTPSGAMRGYAAPQPTFAIETSINIMAEKLGIDPVEIRKKNFVQVGDKWIQPYPIRTNGVFECMDKGHEKINWEGIRNSDKSGRFKRGVGMACGCHISSGAPFSTDHDSVYIAMNYDGTIQVSVGIIEMGTGLKTSFTQIAAEGLNALPETISLSMGDTEVNLADCGDQASRGTYVCGSAIRNGAAEMFKQIKAFACEYTGLGEDELYAKDSAIYSNDGKLLLTYATLARKADDRNIQFGCFGHHKADNAFSWNAHFADVTVDTFTGDIVVNNYIAEHDAGCAINPQLLKASIEGGVFMGMGYALKEQIIYTSDGKQVNDSFHKYMIPVASDIGRIEADFVETDEPSGPYGAKGIGESPVATVAPAIVDAVHNATGVWFDELPVTPERILFALKKGM